MLRRNLLQALRQNFFFIIGTASMIFICILATSQTAWPMWIAFGIGIINYFGFWYLAKHHGSTLSLIITGFIALGIAFVAVQSL